MKLLGPGPPPPEPVRIGDITWTSVEGLTHLVYYMSGSTLTTRCMIPDLRRRNRFGHVYPARSTSYLERELGLAWLYPVTCVWCAADQWRM